MTEEFRIYIKLECLKIAQKITSGNDPAAVIEKAKKLYEYVTNSDD